MYRSPFATTLRKMADLDARSMVENGRVQLKNPSSTQFVVAAVPKALDEGVEEETDLKLKTASHMVKAAVCSYLVYIGQRNDCPLCSKATLSQI